MKRNPYKYSIFMFWLFSLFGSAALADVREYELVIGYRTVDFTGRKVKAMSINGSIPGPTLRFREGDFARIRVNNAMDVETSVHWHGVLLPNRQDGVPYLTTPPIKPGTTHTFEFPIIHSGTYWYHSHTGLQEQRGVYGSIVIEPKHKRIHTDRDHVVVLSDWTDENPDEVLRTLKRGSEYYSIKKDSVQSLLGAIQNNALGDVFRRSLMRMPPMDVSDVAYDKFLANGSPETELNAQPGETVRLRIINASASTYFYLQFAGGPTEIVSADGMDVSPVKLDRMLMAIAETYDVLVRIPRSGAFEFRATAQDGSGHTSAWIGSGARIAAPVVPKPNLYKMHNGGMTMNHGSIPMKQGGIDQDAMKRSVTSRGQNEHSVRMDIMAERPLPPYDRLRSLHPTSLPKDRPIREIKLTLTGDMNRYVWSMGGKTLSEADSIRIRRGENVRFVLVNKTMMHHPMHLHGHFFRVLNKHGAYAPLKHTVDVSPLGTRIIEFYANEEKDWFFHCHILYHLKAGMARVVHYQGSEMDKDIAAVRANLYRDHWFFWADGSFLSQMTDGFAVAENTRNTLRAAWEVGWGQVDETEYDIEVTYEYYFNRFLSPFGGANFTNDSNVGIFGVKYLLPLNFESMVWVDTDGDFRFALGKEVQLTERLSFFGEVEFDTDTQWEGVARVSWTVNKWLSAVIQWHSEFLWGAGFQIRF
ncbi:multicopper oxidase domain-containing protein [Nitrospinota bacterium]